MNIYNYLGQQIINEGFTYNNTYIYIELVVLYYITFHAHSASWKIDYVFFVWFLFASFTDLNGAE